MWVLRFVKVELERDLLRSARPVFVDDGHLALALLYGISIRTVRGINAMTLLRFIIYSKLPLMFATSPR
jgi:hypothetical protein